MRKLLSFVIIGLGLFSLGAASQYVHKTWDPKVEVTGAQAATAADWFISRGAWTGERADVTHCTVWRADGKFWARCQGTKTVPADMLPEGANVVEVIN
jgi:hypothetical protein